MVSIYVVQFYPSGRVKSAPAKEVYLRALDLICQWLGFYLHSIGDFTHHWVKSPLEASKILGRFYLILPGDFTRYWVKSPGILLG